MVNQKRYLRAVHGWTRTPGGRARASPGHDSEHPGLRLSTMGRSQLRTLAVKSLKTGLLTAALAAAALGPTGPARAALGGDASSIDADRVSIKGALTAFRTVKGFAVHEITTPAGVHVQEYVADGKVFAVSWQGPVQPDLRQMLGAYYAGFAQAAATPHPGNHRHLRIEQPGLVVESNGRMRAFYGRAWDPALLPKNFSVADIR